VVVHTVQTRTWHSARYDSIWGTLNAVLLREGLIDRVSVVVAPILIGGKNTSTLIDGESLHTLKDLKLVRPLKLQTCKKLKNSYLHLVYQVMNN